MKATFYFLLTLGILLFILSSCSGDNESFDEEENFKDGTYCADVEYYNPDTGTRSTYNLNVEVENNELTVIYWLNGGWLDDDHFYPEEIDSDGYCSFISDRGYEYNIQITGSECISTDANKAESDYHRNLASITCPKCGYEKSEYDDYCDNCQDEREHTCPRCGEHDSFMSTFDDYCSDCEDKLENTCSRCGGHEYNVNGGLCSSCRDDDE